ncbi:MAG: hypothetical protein ACYCW6_20195 [Candidatus Xenobia bacterium]
MTKRPDDRRGDRGSGGSGKRGGSPKSRTDDRSSSTSSSSSGSSRGKRGPLPGIGDRADRAWRGRSQDASKARRRPPAKKGPRRGAGLPAQQAALREGALGRTTAGPLGGKGAIPPPLNGGADYFVDPKAAKARKKTEKEPKPRKTVVAEAPPPPPVPVSTGPSRDRKAIRLDGKGPYTKQFAATMHVLGMTADDLVDERLFDIDETEDADILRRLVQELNANRGKKREDPAEQAAMDETLYGYDVREIVDHRDEVASRLMSVLNDKKKVHAILVNVQRFGSIQERFGSFKEYMLDKVDRFENLVFDLVYRFEGMKEAQAQDFIEQLGLMRRAAAQKPAMRVLQRWGAIPNAALTPDNWTQACRVMGQIQDDVGCSMAVVEMVLLKFGEHTCLDGVPACARCSVENCPSRQGAAVALS